MKGSNTWSYSPYRPLLTNVGDIYICRVVPQKNAIHFEWLDTDDTRYSIFYRERSANDFLLAGTVRSTEYTINGLLPDTDYEFLSLRKKRKAAYVWLVAVKPSEPWSIICTPTTKLMPFRGAISAPPRWYVIPKGIFLPRWISMQESIRKT